MKELDKVTMKAPVAIGDVVIPNVLGLGVDVVACKKCSRINKMIEVKYLNFRRITNERYYICLCRSR